MSYTSSIQVLKSFSALTLITPPLDQAEFVKHFSSHHQTLLCTVCVRPNDLTSRAHHLSVVLPHCEAKPHVSSSFIPIEFLPRKTLGLVIKHRLSKQILPVSKLLRILFESQSQSISVLIKVSLSSILCPGSQRHHL